MFYKLAVRNVRQSLRNYLLYFLTLTFGVCVFYVFNSIEAQQAMLYISTSTREMMKTLTQLMGIVSIFVSVILGLLIVGANNFLIRRRKKELGIYLLMGMTRSRVARILVTETLIIGIFSLAVGLLGGILASQWLSVFTARLFDADMTSYTFIFSLAAFLKTILYFGLIFIIVMAFSTIAISRYKLIDLINAGRQNEKPRLRRPWLTLLLFLLSLACLGTAYSQVIHNGIMTFDSRLRNEIILGAIGTFLFFASLSGFFLKAIQSHRRLYYRGLNMFILRQVNSRINTAYISMALICLMLFATIGILSTGLGMNAAMEASYKMTSPNDATMSSPRLASIQDWLRERQFNLDAYVANSHEYHEYAQEGLTVGLVLPSLTRRSESDINQATLDYPVQLLKISDYNALMRLHGQPEVPLGSGEAAIYSDAAINIDYLKAAIDDSIAAGLGIAVAGRTLRFYPRLLTDCAATSMSGYVLALIVPDALLADLPSQKTMLVMNCSGNAAATEDRLEADLTAWYSQLDTDTQKAARVVLTTRNIVKSTYAGTKAILSFVGIYLGIIFLITSSAILALQQLSEMADNRRRYSILQKAGADDHLLGRAIFKQTAIYFLLPLALAIVHSIVGLRVANEAIANIGGVNAAYNISVTAAMILLVYGSYFLATYLGSRNMILKGRENRTL